MRVKISKRNYLKGFTLIELVVVMSIMVIINGVIFFDYPSVMANLALKRTAGEIALLARQTQVYSLSAKSDGSGGELVNYGIHFDKTKPAEIILFADTTPNKKYDTGEAIQTFEIQTKDTIDGFSCVGGACIGSTVDIVYQRLSPVAIINNNASISNVKITVKSHRNSTTKDITIYSTGYIK